MSPFVSGFVCGFGSFPRVSGDEPSVIREFDTQTKFSPRERG